MIAPGSIVNGTTYHVTGDYEPAELPTWITQCVSPSTKKDEPSSLTGIPVDEMTLCKLLEHLNPDVDRNSWRDIVAGIHATPLKDDPNELKRLEIADRWSRGDFWSSPSVEYKKGGRKAVEEVFNTMPPKKGGVGFGSLVRVAKKNGFIGHVASMDPKKAFASFETSQTNGSFEIISADAVVPRKVEWVWPDRLARGKLLVLAGSPGEGKSQIGCYMAARISRGDPWIDGGIAPKGRTIILSSEDGIEDTMVPRLMAAGADLSKILFIRATIDPTGNKKRRAFSLQADLGALGELVKLYGDVVLIIIDPITSYMGDKTDTHQTSQVRAVLDPVSDWAERHNVAVLGVSHPPKASQSNAMNAVTGSLAFVGVARLVFCAIEDGSEDGRWKGYSLLLAVKNNLGPKAAGLRYSISGCEIDGEGGKIKTSRIEWNTTEPVTTSADEALAAGRATKREPSKLEQAKQFLVKILKGGPKAVKEIAEAAEKENFSWRTVEAAKDLLPVSARKTALGGGWVWGLTDQTIRQGEEECFV